MTKTKGRRTSVSPPQKKTTNKKTKDQCSPKPCRRPPFLSLSAASGATWRTGTEMIPHSVAFLDGGKFSRQRVKARCDGQKFCRQGVKAAFDAEIKTFGREKVPFDTEKIFFGLLNRLKDGKNKNSEGRMG